MADTRTPSRNPTQPAKGSLAVYSTKDFSQQAAKFESQFNKLIPTTLQRNKILTGDRVIGLLVNLFSNNEDVRQCRPSSILNAAGLACTVGLEFNNSLGQSAIIPYNNSMKVNGEWTKVRDAQWQMMYRGGITLAMRSGVIASIESEVVLGGPNGIDDFDYEHGTNAFLRHKPGARFEANADFHNEWTHAYCLVSFKDGHKTFRVMDRQAIEKIRDQASKGYDNESSPWRKYEEEMIRKTVTKNQLKYLDLTAHASMAVGYDDQAEGGSKQDQVIEWRDYTAEDIDNAKKGYVAGIGNGSRGTSTAADVSDNTEAAETSEVPQHPPALGKLDPGTLGPFTQDQFTPEELTWLIARTKEKGLASTNAQLTGYLSRWRETKGDLFAMLDE